MKRSYLLVQLDADRLTAVFVPGGRGEIDVFSSQGDPVRLAKELRTFALRYAKFSPRVTGLLPRRSVLLTTMDLPTRDRAEARAMALMQFVRSTPHAREEMVVDAVPLSFERSSHGTFSCVMATRMTLAPLASVISQAGLGVCQVTFADFPQDDAWYDWARTFDHGENLYDLRDEAERNADQRRDVTREVKLMAILFATAAVIFMSADGVTLWGKVQELAKLKKELSVISGEVKDLTRRWERIARARDALQRRVAFPLLARALSSSIPEKVRLSQLAFAADQRIKVQGVAETIADVSAFRAALEAEKVCASVDIKELDKHPAGSTEPVSFALSCLWKENR